MARAVRKPTDAPPVEHQEAATRRAAAAQDPTPVDPRTQQLLDALANERVGYVTRGKADRVAQVDEQIKRLGG